MKLAPEKTELLGLLDLGGQELLGADSALGGEASRAGQPGGTPGGAPLLDDTLTSAAEAVDGPLGGGDGEGLDSGDPVALVGQVPVADLAVVGELLADDSSISLLLADIAPLGLEALTEDSGEEGEEEEEDGALHFDFGVGELGKKLCFELLMNGRIEEWN